MRFLLALTGLVLLGTSAFGDDLRIARYDAQRVFKEYKHTKKVDDWVSSKRHPMGPGSYTPEMEQRDMAEKQLAEISEKLKGAANGTKEHDHLEQARKTATLEAELARLRVRLATIHEFDEISAETNRQSTQVCEEILSEAKLLSAERGYALVIPDNPPPNSLCVVVLSVKADDITEELLSRLNKKYEAGSTTVVP